MDVDKDITYVDKDITFSVWCENGKWMAISSVSDRFSTSDVDPIDALDQLIWVLSE